jgi:transcription antitermination factor NusG
MKESTTMGLDVAELCSLPSTNITDELPLGDLKPGPDEFVWFAVQTRTRFEKKVVSGLQEKGIETFLPLFSTKRKWSDRQRLVHLPLFPGYVFVRIAAVQGTRIAVLRTIGVTNFVGVRGVAAPIPDAEIQAIQTVLEQRVPFQLYPYLNVGQRVCIRGGCLDGIEGILAAINGDESLVVSVQLIQRSLAMRISGYQIEPAHSAGISTKSGEKTLRGEDLPVTKGGDGVRQPGPRDTSFSRSRATAENHIVR